MEKIYIFDTTLRDGEQCPGASLNPKEKLVIAQQLRCLNVDVIEAGFPIASPGDKEAVQLISQEIKDATICGLARAKRQDIDACVEALKIAQRRRIHIFIATSDIHLQYKLKITREEVLKDVENAISYAKQFFADIEFSPEDASRTELDFLFKVIEVAIEKGATTINIPDTVGYSLPQEFGDLIKSIKEKVIKSSDIILSCHCHNDLGLGTANSLAGILNGARQVECTINGIGERAGNASLEEIVMCLKTRGDFFKNFYTDINTKEIYKTSRLVSKLTGLEVQPNKAIVGRNAFAHEAGIHQHGVLAKSITYEIMSPLEIGLEESKIILGKHSGKHALEQKLRTLGYHLTEEEVERVFEKFKLLADRKKDVYDEDIISLVEEETKEIFPYFILEYIHITSGSTIIPTATVRIKKQDKIIQESSWGDGPVDACYKAIDKITGIQCLLEEYSIKSVSGGKDALGEVNVKLKISDKLITGRGSSTDIIEASAKAYINALNRYLSLKEQENVNDNK